MNADTFTQAARTEAERVRRDAKYLTPAHRGPLLSSATELLELREAVARVRELHQHGGSMFSDGLEDHTPVCAGCLEEWPCPTIRALDGER